jgi:hypothetical protein
MAVAAERAGHGCGAGEGSEAACGRAAAGVVTDLGENAGREDRS